MPKKAASCVKNLANLRSVGKATLSDLNRLGIYTVSQLRGRSAEELYWKLCNIDGVKHDICVQDVFSAAIAQAENPDLLPEEKNWWYWSRLRKQKKCV